MRKVLPLVVVVVAIASAPMQAQLSFRGPELADRPVMGGEDLLFGEVLLDTYGTYGVIVTFDSRAGLESNDGVTDLVISFESDEPLEEPLLARGFGFVKRGERDLSVVLPQNGISFHFSLDTESQAQRDLRSIQGRSLVYWSPPTSLTMSLGEAMEREQGRQETLIRHVVATELNQDWNPPVGSGGENCGTSCSKTCVDGSQCSISCNSTQCAECGDCPANCYCRGRGGL